MDKLSKDELYSIGLRLDLPELLNFCKSYKKVNELLCKKSYIWKFKIEKDFPRYNSFLPDIDLRNIYIKLYKLSQIKQKLKLIKSLENIYNTKTLCLRGYHTVLPKEIDVLENLEYLDVGNIGLGKIPKEIGNLKN